MNKSEFGRMGESVACEYLKKNDYEIVDRNFYYNGGEIDIIAFDKNKNEIVFFEVKTRTNIKFGAASEAVDEIKIERIKKGIKLYLHIRKWDSKYVRADVLELYYKNDKFYIHHIKQIL